MHVLTRNADCILQNCEGKSLIILLTKQRTRYIIESSRWLLATSRRYHYPGPPFQQRLTFERYSVNSVRDITRPFTYLRCIFFYLLFFSPRWHKSGTETPTILLTFSLGCVIISLLSAVVCPASVPGLVLVGELLTLFYYFMQIHRSVPFLSKSTN